jgi:hypothetical protein|tara:strand:+ start:11575 stop:11682 length:108 start_codon:yes stop_codon:yes gene_type:complete
MKTRPCAGFFVVRGHQADKLVCLQTASGMKKKGIV